MQMANELMLQVGKSRSGPGRLRDASRSFLFALLGTLVLLFIGCSSSREDRIVGKWKSKSEWIRFDFSRDGTCKVGNGPKTYDGTYKFVDEKTFEVAVTREGKVGTEVLEIISKDKLSMKVEDGKIELLRDQ
jgi:hypothetical protein